MNTSAKPVKQPGPDIQALAAKIDKQIDAYIRYHALQGEIDSTNANSYDICTDERST